MPLHEILYVPTLEAPLGVDIDKNVALARSKGKHPLSAYPWFYMMVRGKGTWDYKQLGPQYQDFGNFHFGLVGAAFGLSEDILLRGAGWAQQQSGTSDPAWGKPWGSPPYGDDPHDQEMIRMGFRYYHKFYR